MPGAGGNFLSRCLNLHLEIDCFKKCVGKNYQEKYEVLSYKTVLKRKNPMIQNWIEFEVGDGMIKHSPINEAKNIIIASHDKKKECDIRITNYTKEEFDWARYQGLFKNTVFCLSWLKTGQVVDQKISVPCKNLWDFDLLSSSLVDIEQYIGVEENNIECRSWQKKLWEEWKLTWAPKEIKKIIDQYYYGPKD